MQYLFELFDGNGNDIIEYREFVQFMLQNGEEAARQIATAEKFNRVRPSALVDVGQSNPKQSQTNTLASALVSTMTQHCKAEVL